MVNLYIFVCESTSPLKVNYTCKISVTFTWVMGYVLFPYQRVHTNFYWVKSTNLTFKMQAVQLSFTQPIKIG